jgi:putative phosphonate metabolism protein
LRRFDRYAVYFTPEGALAQAGAAWLGWDIAGGLFVEHPDGMGVDLGKITQKPRKYGLHGTLKPPFVLAEGTDVHGLRDAVAALADTLDPVGLDGLEIAMLGPFLALKPMGDQTALGNLAAKVVMQLDPFRAAPSKDELARRRQAHLSPAQEAHLLAWGYPYVLEQFRFHLTLTGRLSQQAEPDVMQAAKVYFAPYIKTPMPIDSITLAGQGTDGMFYEIERFRL